jgi:hypothetical protein
VIIVKNFIEKLKWNSKTYLSISRKAEEKIRNNKINHTKQKSKT